MTDPRNLAGGIDIPGLEDILQNEDSNDTDDAPELLEGLLGPNAADQLDSQDSDGDLNNTITENDGLSEDILGRWACRSVKRSAGRAGLQLITPPFPIPNSTETTTGVTRPIAERTPQRANPKVRSMWVRSMLHCECSWAWECEDDPTPYCPFCGKVGAAGPGAPPEAQEAITEVRAKHD